MKKLISMLLSVFMVLTLLAGFASVSAAGVSITVCGETLDATKKYLHIGATDSHTTTVTANETSAGASAEYDSATGTLKFLQDSSLKYIIAGESYAVASEGNIIIDLNGYNVTIETGESWVQTGYARANSIRATGSVTVTGQGKLTAFAAANETKDAAPKTAAIYSDTKITINAEAVLYIPAERAQSSSTNVQAGALYAPKVEFGASANVFLGKAKAPSAAAGSTTAAGKLINGTSSASDVVIASILIAKTATDVQSGWVWNPGSTSPTLSDYAYANLNTATYMQVSGGSIKFETVTLNASNRYVHVPQPYNSANDPTDFHCDPCIANNVSTGATAEYNPETKTLRFLSDVKLYYLDIRGVSSGGKYYAIASDTDLTIDTNGHTVVIEVGGLKTGSIARMNCIHAAGTLTVTGGGKLTAYINSQNSQDSSTSKSAPLYSDTAVVLDDITAQLFVGAENATPSSPDVQGSAIYAPSVTFTEKAYVKLAKEKTPYNSTYLICPTTASISIPAGSTAEYSNSLYASLNANGMPNDSGQALSTYTNYASISSARYMKITPDAKYSKITVSNVTLTEANPYLVYTGTYITGANIKKSNCTASASSTNAVAQYLPDTKTLKFLADIPYAKVLCYQATEDPKYLIYSDSDLTIDTDGHTVYMEAIANGTNSGTRTANCIYTKGRLKLTGGGTLYGILNANLVYSVGEGIASVILSETGVLFDNITAYLCHSRDRGDSAGGDRNLMSSVVTAPTVEFTENAHVAMSKIFPASKSNSSTKPKIINGWDGNNGKNLFANVIIPDSVGAWVSTAQNGASNFPTGNMGTDTSTTPASVRTPDATIREYANIYLKDAYYMSVGITAPYTKLNLLMPLGTVLGDGYSTSKSYLSSGATPTLRYHFTQAASASKPYVAIAAYYSYSDDRYKLEGADILKQDIVYGGTAAENLEIPVTIHDLTGISRVCFYLWDSFDNLAPYTEHLDLR